MTTLLASDPLYQEIDTVQATLCDLINGGWRAFTDDPLMVPVLRQDFEDLQAELLEEATLQRLSKEW